MCIKGAGVTIIIKFKTFQQLDNFPKMPRQKIAGKKVTPSSKAGTQASMMAKKSAKSSKVGKGGNAVKNEKAMKKKIGRAHV